MITAGAVGAQAPRLRRTGARVGLFLGDASVGGVGVNRQAFSGVDAQSRLQASGRDARELRLLCVPEGRVDAGAID